MPELTPSEATMFVEKMLERLTAKKVTRSPTNLERTAGRESFVQRVIRLDIETDYWGQTGNIG